MRSLEEIEKELLSGPQGGEPEVGVPQYQACIGARDALDLLAEVRRLREENGALKARLANNEAGWMDDHAGQERKIARLQKEYAAVVDQADAVHAEDTEKIDKLQARVKELEEGIRKHRDAHPYSRCLEDHRLRALVQQEAKP